MIIYCHRTLITTNLHDCDIKCIHVSFLDVVTLFLRNRWYQALLNNYSCEDVSVVSLMQKTNIHELMSFGFHVWGFAATKQFSRESRCVGCGPPTLSHLHFNSSFFSLTANILYPQARRLLCGKRIQKPYIALSPARE